MPVTGRCPDCGAPLRVSRQVQHFACPQCGSPFQLLKKDGRMVVRRADPIQMPPPEDDSFFLPQARPAPAPVVQELSDPFKDLSLHRPEPARAERQDDGLTTSEQIRGWYRAAQRPRPAPEPEVRGRPAMTGRRLRVAPRTGPFLLLILTAATILLQVPLVNAIVLNNPSRIPGTSIILRRGSRLEEAGATETTTARVLDTRIMETRKRGVLIRTDYEIQYEFEVDGTTYSYSDDTGRTGLWGSIDEDLWRQIDATLRRTGSATIEVTYVRDDPWDNIPMTAEANSLSLAWVFWVVVSLVNLGAAYQIGLAIRDYRVARRFAQEGEMGHTRYWDILPA